MGRYNNFMNTLPHNVCTRCRKRLGPKAIRAAKMQFHPQCFLCDACKQPLEKNFYPKGERLYHESCYERMFVPRCAQCGEAIKGRYVSDESGRFHPDCYTQLHNLICSICNESIQGQYLYDHWGNKAHPQHPQGKTSSCHVCARLVAPEAHNSKSLKDGRMLCGPCHADEISTFQAIQAAKIEVIQQMQTVGFDYIPDYVKVELSPDQQLLNERLRASPTGNIHGFTRTAQRNIPQYGLILEHSISVLSGLPRVAFMSVLAHELLHVWINENNLKHLSHAEVEGFCNLGGALICRNDGGELAQVLLRRMDEDPDPAYGAGYRAMAWRLERLGWPALIAALRDATRPLPPAPPEILKAKERQALPPKAKPARPAGVARPTERKAPYMNTPKTAPSAHAAVPGASASAGQASSRASERLQAFREKYKGVPATQDATAQSSRPQNSANIEPNSTQNAANSSQDKSSLSAAEKVRARFAQAPAKPPAKKGGSSRLKKLNKKRKK